MAEERVVAVAVDGSDHSDNALNYYIDRVQQDGDKLLLIHVPEEYNLTDASPGIIQELLSKLREKTENLKRQYTEKLKNLKIPLTFQFGNGKPGEEVVRIAEEEHASLIMIGTRGHGWLRRTILGSVSSYVLNHTSIPVLVCKHFEQFTPSDLDN